MAAIVSMTFVLLYRLKRRFEPSPKTGFEQFNQLSPEHPMPYRHPRN